MFARQKRRTSCGWARLRTTRTARRLPLVPESSWGRRRLSSAGAARQHTHTQPLAAQQLSSSAAPQLSSSSAAFHRSASTGCLWAPSACSPPATHTPLWTDWQDCRLARLHLAASAADLQQNGRCKKHRAQTVPADKCCVWPLEERRPRECVWWRPVSYACGLLAAGSILAPHCSPMRPARPKLSVRS